MRTTGVRWCKDLKRSEAGWGFICLHFVVGTRALLDVDEEVTLFTFAVLESVFVLGNVDYVFVAVHSQLSYSSRVQDWGVQLCNQSFIDASARVCITRNGRKHYPSDSLCPGKKEFKACGTQLKMSSESDRCSMMDLTGKCIALIRCTLCIPHGSQCYL